MILALDTREAVGSIPTWAALVLHYIEEKKGKYLMDEVYLRCS